jgi:hypothetical protein
MALILPLYKEAPVLEDSKLLAIAAKGATVVLILSPLLASHPHLLRHRPITHFYHLPLIKLKNNTS